MKTFFFLPAPPSFAPVMTSTGVLEQTSFLSSFICFFLPSLGSSKKYNFIFQKLELHTDDLRMCVCVCFKLFCLP